MKNYNQAYIVSTFNSTSDKDGEKYFSHYEKIFLETVGERFPIVDFVFDDDINNSKIFLTLTEAQNICKMLSKNIASISTNKDIVCLTTYCVVAVDVNSTCDKILEEIGLIWSITI